MGEKNRSKKSNAKILADETRCVYCEAVPTQIEHMPPRTMFRDRSRPKGLEFAACSQCNNGTSTSDLVASAISRLGTNASQFGWEIADFIRLRKMLRIRAPEVLKEIFVTSKPKETLTFNEFGEFRQLIVAQMNGPVINAHLNVFAAKLGMALYREHIGSPLPQGGITYSQWFLNSGISQEAANNYLKILPLVGSLKQGKFGVKNQFVYRYNCDNRSIVAALSKFHEGLFIFNIATSESERYAPILPSTKTSSVVLSGELLKHIPPVHYTVDMTI